MHKRLLSTSALLLAAGFAVPAFAQVTVSLGVQSSQLFVESETTFLASDPKVVDPSIRPLNLADADDNQATDVGGELALGYQFNVNSIFNIALEGFGQLAATTVDTPIFPDGADVLLSEIETGLTTPLQSAKATFNWLAGLRVRPGLYITPKTRVFVDGGVVWGGFELEQSRDTVDFLNAVSSFDFDHKESKTLIGWRYGVGAEYDITDNFVVGVDYTVTGFDEFNSEFVEEFGEYATTTGLFGTVTSSASYVPTFHTLGLNFKYQFGAKREHKQPHTYIDK